MVIKKYVTFMHWVIMVLAQALLVVTIIAVPAQAQSPVGYWAFDDGSGTKAADSSGNGHTATLVNGITWVAGKVGDAVSANAASKQYVSIPAIDLSGTQAVTVALWTNRSYSTSGGHVLFEDSINYSNSTTGFAVFPDDNTCNGIRAALRGNLGNVGNCYSQPSSGVWHHLAVVFDKSQTGGDEVKFYVDGVLQAVNRSLNASTNTNNFGNNPIYLYSRAGSTQFSSGNIDDLRIYNSALKAEQIQELYSNPGLVSIAVTPTNPSIAVGKQQQFTATGTFSDGSRKDLTSSVTWTSSAPSVATIGSGGLATGVAAGSTTIQATLATVNGSTGLTVTAPNFTVSASPASLSVAQGKQGTSTITTAISGGFNSAISLSASGMPSGTTVSFNPATMPAPGSGNSTMTITVGAGTLVGTYPITVTGNGGGIQQTATLTLTVTATANFTISASPASLSIVQGNQGTSTITTAISGGFNSAIALSASGMPSGTTVSFNPATIPAPGSGNSTMTITVGAGTLIGTYPITVTGNGGGIQRTATVTLTVTAAPSFTISASPASLNVAQGNLGTSTITIMGINGFNSAITLSASGVPSGTTVSFNPNPVPAPGSGNSAMTITVGANTPAGTYPITVTGTGGGIQQNTMVTLTVTAAATISYVQGNYANPDQSVTTVAVTFSAAQAAGDLNVVVVGWGDSTAAVKSITDNSGNTYTLAVGPTIISGELSQSIYYAKNIAAAAAGANTVTVTFSTAAAYPDIRILEYKGADPNNPVDVTAANTGNSATSNSGSATTTNPTDLIFGANVVGTYTSGPGSGFTQRLLTHDGNIAEDLMVTTAGSYSATAPLTSSCPWIMQMVAFRTPGPPVLVSIVVTPTNPSIMVGGHQQFTATGTYSDGSHQDLTSSATWTSSVPSVATITSAGLATGVAVGNTTIQASSGSINGSTNLTVTASGNFTISASPASLSIGQGNQGISTVTTTISGGFNASISLSASGVPSGTTVSFSTNPIPAPGSGNSTMSITVGASTPTGTYPITVTGNGGGIQQSATVTLTVTAQANFTISASPSSLSVGQGNQGTSTISTTISNGFNSSISLSASGVPSGTTVSFNPQTIPAPGSGNSTMTITVGANTPMGTYPITVTGNGGGIQQQVTITLTVTAQVALSWTASSSPGIAGYNAYRSTNSNGPYTKLNATLISTTNYNDQAVQSGNTYYYVTTAVDSQGDESAYSNQASATIP